MIMLMLAMDDKTEKATPKKRKDARERGQVVKSGDLSTGLLLLVMFGTLKFAGGYSMGRLKYVFTKYLTAFDSVSESVTTADVTSVFFDLTASFFIMVAPLLLASVVMSFLVNYLQVGFLYTTKTLKPEFSKINPIEGFKRIFSMNALVEMLKSNIKFIVIAGIIYKEVNKNIADFPMLMNSEIIVSVKLIIDLIMSIAFKTCIALMIIAVFDYLYQWWRHERNLMMTKQEVKEELKQMEGDPNIKGRIKQKQREMSMMRMMAQVPKADVVITNPTHYAVALQYDEKQHSAPIVLAKGKDLVALRIKEKAKEHNIEIVENKPLAQALYAAVDIGDEIPQEFYAAVAEILAKIYSIKKQKDKT